MKNINQALTKGLGVWKNSFHMHKDLEMSCCRASSSVQWFVCYEGAGESGTDGGRERETGAQEEGGGGQVKSWKR